MRFQLVPQHFDQARLGYDIVTLPDIYDVDRQPISKWRPRKPEVEITIDRNELATRFQLLTQYLRPCWTRP